MLDFRNLRSSLEGQRGSFEELVCQLAAIIPPPAGTRFRRIEGSGGDGGIECYWELQDGSKHGYQAKFYTAARDIDWSAIDQSFQTAAATYSEMSAFTVAIACNLGGEVRKRKGIAGTKRWEDLCAKWSDEMATVGRSVSFQLWGEFELGLMLASAAAEGLLAFWFDEAFLSEKWLNDRFDETALRLDERFHPEDHVDVSAGDAIKGARRSHEWEQAIRSAYQAVTDEGAGNILQVKPGSRVTRALHAQLTRFHLLQSELATSIDVKFSTAALVSSAQAVSDLAYRFERVLQRAAASTPRGKSYSHRNSPPFQEEREQLSKLKLATDLLVEELASVPSAAADARQLLLTGNAGTGKSHLLASEVQHALREGSPALLLLGTDFASSSDPGGQILNVLDLRKYSFDAFLNAFNAAALRAGKRGLIAIDALNEGIGEQLWRNHLVSLAKKVGDRPALSLVISVRTEFINLVVPASIQKTMPTLRVVGFAEAEEEEAAAEVYMDRRGIIRPATPWLSPEFTNPLFLRTTCLALQRSGKTEFPRGLLGTKQLLAFYLDTAATNLGSSYDGTTELVRPLRQAVAAIARTMATNHQDYISRSESAQVVDAAFKNYAAPQGRTWTDLIQRSGLLRTDAPPYDPDPLSTSEPIYRFGFQRFQDHLIAEALLKGAQPQNLFQAGGALAFMLDQGGLAWEWLGVFQAVAIQLADDYGIEVVDVLPGGQATWWVGGPVQEAFCESVRWRSPRSFTHRTEYLLDQLDYGPAQAISLLLEVSIVKEHMWNADYLHTVLCKYPLPERDAFWTEAINSEARESSSPANRLVDWALRRSMRHADKEALRLSLLVLGWLFTSTDGQLRDRATKAAVEILLLAPSQFGSWLRAFSSVDDAYVVERLLASAAGACLRDPSPERLKIFSRAIDEELLQTGRLPVHLLARDYAALILEAAAAKKLLSSSNFNQGRLSLTSKPPSLNLNPAAIEAQARAVGDRRILASCIGLSADFGRYVIDSRARDISTVPLSVPQPMTYEEAAKDFAKLAIEGQQDKAELYDLLASTRPSRARLEADVLAESRKLLCDHLRTQIDPAHLGEFDAIILPYLNGSDGMTGSGAADLPRHDPAQMRMWVAKRALDLGWTSQLFPRDGSSGDDRTRSSRTERIGKKYQWIAFHELLARLADNFWLAPGWNEGRARRYGNPCDLSFTRDLDPTAPSGSNTAGVKDTVDLPRLVIRSKDGSMLDSWVFEDVARNHLKQTQSLGASETKWAALFRSEDANTRWPIPSHINSAPYRQQEFSYAFLVMCDPTDRAAMIKYTRQSDFDFYDWLDSDFVDGPYLYELGIRGTWPADSWQNVYLIGSRQYRVRRPWHSYAWEHHLDGSLPKGLNLVVPAPWILRELKLAADPLVVGTYRNARGEVVIRSYRDGRQAWCLIREAELAQVLASSKLSPLWVGFGERGAWPKPADHHGFRRRWNGVLASSAKRSNLQTWHEDFR